MILFFFVGSSSPSDSIFFTYRVFSGNLRLFFSYPICLSPDCSDDVDMTVCPPKRTAPATLEPNQSFLEDGAVTSLYHQTNNLGSLSFIFFFFFFFFAFLFFLFFSAFLVKHIYTIQNNKFSQFQNLQSV